MIDLDNKLMNDPGNKEVALQYTQAKTTYDSILQEENEQLRFRARVNIYEKGEKSTNFFFRQIKQNAARSNIASLEINGKMSDDPIEINNAIHNYYKQLYKEEINVSQAIADDKCLEFLVEDIPKISQEQRNDCDKKISSEEVRQILFKELNGRKSPGNDGLTVSLYQSKWDLLEPHFLKCLEYAIDKGELSSSQKQGVVRLIEKKDKDRRILDNWRPISLLNVDTKIFSKILANRIKKVLPSIIGPEQTAFVKGRYIGEGIQVINGILEYYKEKIDAGILLAIDFKKAFDSINHKFIFKTLIRVQKMPFLMVELRRDILNLKDLVGKEIV